MSISSPFSWRAARHRRVSVGTKFGLITALCTILVMIGSALIVRDRLAAEDAARSAEAARTTAAHIGEAVKSVFRNAFAIVDTTEANIVALKDEGVSDPKVYDVLLKRMVEAGSDHYGAWLHWDKSDQPLNVGAGDHLDAAGNLAVYWHQNGIEMLQDAVAPEILGSDLYRVPYTTDHAFLLEPHAIDAVAGDTTLVTSFATPLEHDGKVVGVLALDVKLDAIADALAAIALPNGASFAVVSDGGIVAMATRRPDARHQLTPLDAPSKRLLDAARKGDGSARGRSVDNTTNVLSSWSAIRFSGIRNPWFLVMTVPEPSLLATTTDDQAFLLLVGGGALLTILVTVLFSMNRLIAVPLKRLSAIINGLGQGLFDFEVRGRSRTDEVGDVARAVERLQQSGMEIARLQEESGESEYIRQQNRRAELDDISTHFSTSIEGLVSALGNVASTVETQSQDVSAHTKAASGRLLKVSDASAAAGTSMSRVASATTSLLATIGEIGDRTREGKAAAGKVEHNAHSTDRSIGVLKQTVGDIDRVTSLIRGVAAQINLIALNATIEAARAGESGRGFSVVAQEIKILAAQTATATEEIGRHVRNVQDATAAAGADVVEMKQAFAQMHVISSDIAGALEVQINAAGEIKDLVHAALGAADSAALHLSQLVQSASHVEGAADVMHEQSGSLGKEVGRLGHEVAQFLNFLKAA